MIISGKIKQKWYRAILNVVGKVNFLYPGFHILGEIACDHNEKPYSTYVRNDLPTDPWTAVTHILRQIRGAESEIYP